MNAARAQLGLDDTHYANPIGLDDAAQLLDRARPRALALRLRAPPFFRTLADRTRAALQQRRPRAHAREPQHAGRRRARWSTGVKTGHTQQRRLRAGRLGHAPRRSRWSRSCSATPSEAARDADTLELLAWALQQLPRVARRPRGRRRWRGRRSATAAARSSRSSPARDACARVVRTRRARARSRDVGVPDEVAGPIARGAAARLASTCSPTAAAVATRADRGRGGRPGGGPRASAPRTGSRARSRCCSRSRRRWAVPCCSRGVCGGAPGRRRATRAEPEAA